MAYPSCHNIFNKLKNVNTNCKRHNCSHPSRLCDCDESETSNFQTTVPTSKLHLCLCYLL